jgi:hypothetical protein
VDHPGRSSGLLNFAAHSPKDSQHGRKSGSARIQLTAPKGLFQYRTAAVCASPQTSADNTALRESFALSEPIDYARMTKDYP